jgi:ornithine cyclodeaminase
MDYQILTDQDIYRLLDMKTVIEIIEESFSEQSQGHLIHPPRVLVDGAKGTLVFTVGDSPNQEKGLGFRVYSRFNNSTTKNEQLVAVFDSENGDFKGAVIGTAIGNLRTGAIGGVAIKYLARQDAKVLGIIGTGNQAASQLQAAVEVREFEKILVYSRKQNNRVDFSNRMTAEFGRNILPMNSAQDVVTKADVLICATTSLDPVFDPAWVKPGTHITTMGPSSVQGHELPLDAAIKSDLVSTDSLPQIEAIGKNYFLHDHSPFYQYIHLSDIVAGKHTGRTAYEQQTLFCSIGLAGTEVAVASHALALRGSRNGF